MTWCCYGSGRYETTLRRTNDENGGNTCIYNFDGGIYLEKLRLDGSLRKRREDNKRIEIKGLGLCCNDLRWVELAQDCGQR